MIVRSWRGRTHEGKADAYLAFLEEEIFPQIRALPGNLGVRVLRAVDREHDFLVLSQWTDLESVRAFSGPDPSVAVVEPEARALLADFDEEVEHFEVVSEG